jgi:hypothetical protein
VGFSCFVIYRLRRDAGSGVALLHSANRAEDLYFTLAAVLFLFVAKAPLLFLSRPVQADEAQYGANALLAKDGWLNWDNLDSGSSGPLQSMVQAWPVAYGGDVTYTTIHLTGIVLTCIIVAAMYGVVRTRVGPSISIIVCFPAILFLGGITHWEIDHASSTLPPMALTLLGTLAVAHLLSERRKDGPGMHAIALSAAFALGLIPLVKPHAAIMGAYVGGALLLVYAGGAQLWRWRIIRAVLLIVFAVVPSVISVAGVLASGRWTDFTLEVFGYTEGYMPGGRELAIAWARAGWAFIKAGLQEPLLGVFYLMVALAYLYLGGLWLKRWRQSGAFTIFALGLLAVSIVSVLMPARGHLYYLLIIIPILPISAAALAAETVSLAGWWAKPSYLTLVAGAAALLLLPGTIWDAVNSPAALATAALSQTGPRFAAPRILSFLAPSPDARLAVFGYMPHFYIDAQLRPGTRETSSENMIVNRPHRDDYRRRYIEELDRSRPEIFIDTVGKGSFVYVDPAAEGVGTVPGLRARLDAHYELISSADRTSTCAEIYLRKDLAERMKVRLAPVASVKASGVLSEGELYKPSNVIDRHVFENCPDRWLGPQGQPAWIELQLAAKTPVAEVALLNTRGVFRTTPEGEHAYYNNQVSSVATLQAAWHAEVLLVREGEVVARRDVTVDAYPYWTRVAFPDAPEATAVRIVLPDWRGQGAGLNEIVITQRSPMQTTSVPDKKDKE